MHEKCANLKECKDAKYDISMHKMLSLILCAYSMQLNYGLPLMLTLSACETALQGEFKISFTSPWAFLQADMYEECSAVGLERNSSAKIVPF